MINKWHLIRFNSSPEFTQGMLIDPEWKLFCYTLEPPWINNDKNISCIPFGLYQCVINDHVKTDGNSYKAYELKSVPKRTDIEIHVGNYVDDTKGCILLGDKLGYKSVFASTPAFDRFMEQTNNDDILLDICDISSLLNIRHGDIT